MKTKISPDWYLIHNQTIVGKLTPNLSKDNLSDMFWVEYQVVAENGFEALVYNQKSWQADIFSYQDNNQQTAELASSCGELRSVNNHYFVLMRGLYLNKKTKLIHTLPKFLIGILFWGTYFLPIYSFEKAFRLLEVTSNDFWGVYRDSVVIFGFIAIILTLLSLRFSPKFFHQFWYKIAIIVSYLVFYYLACTSIAWDYRSLFSATWQWSEIFSELVKPHWYFYVFGGLGVYFHYQYQALIQDKIKKQMK